MKPKTLLIATHTGRRPVNVSSIDITISGFTLFTHKEVISPKHHHWVVSEFTTGQLVQTGAIGGTRTAARIAADHRVENDPGLTRKRIASRPSINPRP